MSTKPTTPRDITTEELEAAMREYLTKRGDTPAAIAAYVEAQKLAGWLRPRCPAWLRNSAILYFLLPNPKWQSERLPD